MVKANRQQRSEMLEPPFRAMNDRSIHTNQFIKYDDNTSHIWNWDRTKLILFSKWLCALTIVSRYFPAICSSLIDLNYLSFSTLKFSKIMNYTLNNTSGFQMMIHFFFVKQKDEPTARNKHAPSPRTALIWNPRTRRRRSSNNASICK